MWEWEKEPIDLNAEHECLCHLDNEGVCEICGKDMVLERDTMIERIKYLEKQLQKAKKNESFYETMWHQSMFK